MRSVVTVPAAASLITYTPRTATNAPRTPARPDAAAGRIAAITITTPSAMDHAVDSLSRCPPMAACGTPRWAPKACAVASAT